MDVACSDVDQLEEFHQHLNRQHPQIQFTMEMEADNQISFLHAWEGNIQLKGGCVDPTEGRDNTEPET